MEGNELHGWLLTDPGELGLEVGEVLAAGDAEVVVGVVVLSHARRRVRRADAEHGGRSIRALRTPDLADGGRSAAHGRRRRHQLARSLLDCR
jgi:hypothetical protein